MIADFSPVECSRIVEVGKQSRLAHVGGASTHLYTWLTQGTQVCPESTFRWPRRDGFTAEILEGFRKKKVEYEQSMNWIVSLLFSLHTSENLQFVGSDYCGHISINDSQKHSVTGLPCTASTLYLMSDISMNPLQHSLTGELSRSERLHLQQHSYLVILWLKSGNNNQESQKVHIYNLRAQNGSDCLPYISLVARIYSPHVGLADECLSIRVLGGDLRSQVAYYNTCLQFKLYCLFSWRSCLPVSWWACLCRSRCCLMSAVGQIVAEGTHSRELPPRWELDPHRGTRGR